MDGSAALLFLVLWPIFGGIISFMAGKIDRRFRDYIADSISLIELAAAVLIIFKFNAHSAASNISFSINGICGLGINFTLDGFRAIYVLIIAYMWAETTLFSREYLEHHHNRNRYYLFVLMTLGAIMGVFLSADLYTTFIFFEIMSLVSCVMVVQDETQAAIKAAQTYIAIAIIGGLATLTGLVILNNLAGTLNIAELHDAVKNLISTSSNSISSISNAPDGLAVKKMLYVSGILIFTGFASKAAIFPAHIWLPTAHTAAPAPASALLSGLLTKAGLFGVLVLSSQVFTQSSTSYSWGIFLLILALITMVLGAVLAVFSVNIKRTLACSSMSQLGFIMTGIAMQCLLPPGHNDLAVRGTVLYMVGHSLIKLVLFLDAGIIHMNTHKLDLNEIRGFGRGKKIFAFAFLMGGLGLMGMPLLNGYIGKTLIHEAIVEYIAFSQQKFLFQCAEWTFLISGALTTAYVLKLFVMLFIAKPDKKFDNYKNKKYIKFTNSVFLLISSLTLPIIGLMPYKIADKIGFMGSGFMSAASSASLHHHAVNYFSFEALEGAAISIGLGTVIFFVFVKNILMREDLHGEPVCLDLWPKWLNIEYLIFRPVIAGILPFIGALFARVTDLILSGPVTLILSRASRQRFVQLPEDTDFGFYHDEEPEQSLRTVLPSSLAYSLMTFIFGLLFVFAYLVL